LASSAFAHSVRQIVFDITLNGFRVTGDPSTFLLQNFQLRAESNCEYRPTL